MADLATPRAADPTSPAVAVAFSGGLDSTALLHAVARAATAHRVVALHVHHGLMPAADSWRKHCETQAHALGAEFVSTRLSGCPSPGESVEAWARLGRHGALHDMAVAAGADLLLLAHHRRDQAETFLLQAMRGAGTAGMSAMPRSQWRDGVRWVRPWLDHPRDRILAYAEHHGLRWIDDPSNDDPRYARNRLRASLWPAFKANEAGLAQAARWAQEAEALAQEVAAGDLERLVQGARLDLVALHALSPARKSNALRAWLRPQMAISSQLVQRLLEEWRPGAVQAWDAPGGRLHAWRDGLYWASGAEVPQASARLDLSRPGFHRQPDWGGGWSVEPVGEGGVPASVLAQLTQRVRGPGDQFQRGVGTVPRSLKKAYQELDVPPWRRDGPVLADADGRVVAVAGLGMDARAFAARDEPCWSLRWLEDSALPQSEGEGVVDA
ncbi:tRNA lysidine(34) synthetase TilS [Roseateles sp. BYS87W]|uniref:tRNA(Ile)-lysidine synthase n=1 Tax=Pelomonas baiyunensis TaxID=3299026 RepID=A0ABW7GVX7_9BURK